MAFTRNINYISGVSKGILTSILLGLTLLWGDTAVVMTIDGAIDPPVAQYVNSGIEQAEKSGASVVIITLDTPGGLLSATKNIVDKILASSVPVVVFVYPAGARAASAGVFITMAAHIAAMAPGTHIGAAHPVFIGPGSDTSSVMREKVTNDAVAWLKSLAKLRHRNFQWAYDAVRESKSLTADEAESLGVIDLIARNMDELLSCLDGAEFFDGDTARTIHLSSPQLVRFDMSLPQKFLHKILNPNLAYLLLMLGLLGIFFEFQHPGAIAPGVVGTISLLCAAYAFQILPVNYVGILLIIAGIIMFVLEVKLPGFGLLTAGGVVSMLLGSFMLTAGNPPELSINWWTIIPTVAFVALFFIFVVAKALLIQRKKPTTGLEGLVGEIGEVDLDIPANGVGKVFVHGEIWNATSSIPLRRGQRCRVVEIRGMTLVVEPTENSR